MGISGSKSKKSEVLQHWIAIADGFNLPSQEFYEAVEKQLAARKIPNLEISRVEFAEGGILSGKRVYLRMIRERLAFDACAAPFGNTYFFSCRTVYAPAVLEIWHVLVVSLFFLFVYYWLARLVGTSFAPAALLGLIVAIAQIFRNTIALGLSDLDATLLKIPAIGPIYERFFRKDSYYRQDTRLVYLEIVPKIIKELADELTGAKGIKLVRQYEQAPILGELYKPVPPSQSGK
jgi:hypothetical protein